jgi:hypothetical protein
MSQPPAHPESRPSMEADRRLPAIDLPLWHRAVTKWCERENAEAIARLSPAQRESLLREVGDVLPPGERALAGPANATPLGIARLIARASRGRPDLAAQLVDVLRAARPGAILGGAIAGAALGGMVGGMAGAAASDAVAHPCADATPTAADADLTGSGGLDLGGLFDL